MNVKWRGLASYFLLLLVVMPALGQPVIGVKKMIVREMDVLPGYTYNTTATVTLVFDGEGVVSFTDYVAYASQGDVVSTERADSSVLVGGFRATSWRNLNVSKGYTLKYSVPAENLFNISISLEADGKSIALNCSSGYCVGVALRARLINYSIAVAPLNPAFSKLQLPVSVSWSVDPTYLYPVSFSESPQSMRESGSEVSFQWSSVMNGSYSLSVVFEVRGENPWGEIFIPQPIIMITLDPRVQSMLMSKYREYAEKFLGSTLGNLTEFEENATRLRDLLYNLSRGFREQAKLLSDAASQAEEAAGLMLTASSQLEQLSWVAESLRGEIGSELSKASKLLEEARGILEGSSMSVSLTEAQLERVFESLNLTYSNVSFSSIRELIERSKSRLEEARSMLEKYRSTLQYLDRVGDQASAAAGNMAVAARKLMLMASMLREASSNLSTLSDGLERAAELMDTLIGRVERVKTAEYFPEGFREFNQTFYKQIVESNSPEATIRTDFMGEAYYFSLPAIKIKRSEPNVSGLTIDSNPKKISSLWPVPVAAAILGAVLFIGRRGNRYGNLDEERVARLNALRERISRIMGETGA
jgi:hypothetical protein